MSGLATIIFETYQLNMYERYTKGPKTLSNYPHIHLSKNIEERFKILKKSLKLLGALVALRPLTGNRVEEPDLAQL